MLKLKEERDEVIATRSEKLLPHLVSLHSGKSFFKVGQSVHISLPAKFQAGSGCSRAKPASPAHAQDPP